MLALHTLFHPPSSLPTWAIAAAASTQALTTARLVLDHRKATMRTRGLTQVSLGSTQRTAREEPTAFNSTLTIISQKMVLGRHGARRMSHAKARAKVHEEQPTQQGVPQRRIPNHRRWHRRSAAHTATTADAAQAANPGRKMTTKRHQRDQYTAAPAADPDGTMLEPPMP